MTLYLQYNKTSTPDSISADFIKKYYDTINNTNLSEIKNMFPYSIPSSLNGTFDSIFGTFTKLGNFGITKIMFYEYKHVQHILNQNQLLITVSGKCGAYLNNGTTSGSKTFVETFVVDVELNDTILYATTNLLHHSINIF